MPSAAFDAAAAKAKTLTAATNDDLLALYKYFKQATVGDGAFPALAVRAARYAIVAASRRIARGQ